MRIETEAQGAKFRFQPGCRIGSSLLKKGVYEPLETKILSERLQPGDVFIDIGAHIGYHAVLASKKVGDQGLVIAFEPDPVTYGLLTLNLEQNGCRSVLFYNAAVLDRNGTTKLFLSKENPADSRCYDARDGRTSIEVGCVTLDSAFHHLQVKPRFIKIDTQGSEIEVLRGAQAILARGPELLVEWWPKGLALAGHKPIELLTALEAAGYRLYWPNGQKLSKPSLLWLAETKPLQHTNLYGRKET